VRRNIENVSVIFVFVYIIIESPYASEISLFSTVTKLLGKRPHLFSNGNASETKANESFDNGVFSDIEAKRTLSIVSKLFSKQSEHIR
jgi:hypothetical protein